MNITTADIEQATQDERWGGWGYLGARHNGDAAETARADRIVVAKANERGWDYETFFAFVNSRAGRHVADILVGGGNRAHVDAEIDRFVTEYVKAAR